MSLAQPALFPDENAPCRKCAGRGVTGPEHEERRCYSCGGTGLQKDVYDPSMSEIPL